MDELIHWVRHIFDILYGIWQFKLFSVDQRPITVSNIFIGLAFLVLGIWASRRATELVKTRLISRLHLGVANEATFEKLISYFFLSLAVLFALNMANVPLTVFTLLGGALAIGVGFGSQNVVNNFISGLIMMIEQPVKVGDIVEIGSLRGMIEHIGARSTRMRSYTNTHIVVPNSTFLQSNVVNWTLADDTVLTSVVVGVAYGSPTREVEELVLKAIEGEPRALNFPKPVVLFQAFGPSSLDFEVYFGVKLKTHIERMKIESDVRHAIDRILKESSIEISFPQRDVHLDTKKPLQVTLLERH